MTAQLMDRIEVDDQRWTLCRWGGADMTPSSESLGFATEMANSANIRGRVDHFVIDRGKLRLSHVDANLTSACRDFVPKGGAREDIKHTYWAQIITDHEDYNNGGSGKPRAELLTARRVVLYFAELWVPFSGTIVAGRDFDDSKYVHAGRQRESSFRVRLMLDLKKGRVVARRLENDRGTDQATDDHDNDVDDDNGVDDEANVFDDEKTQSD